MRHISLNITAFARDFLGIPLYPYQAEIAETIVQSVLGGHGHVFSVMMARQTGKNQLSAVIEAYLLSCMPQGTIVKAAPTFTPQVLNSRLRLLSLLSGFAMRRRVWLESGYIVGATPLDHPLMNRAHIGPRVMFYSAAEHSNVVGATADLLLEIDEAQDVSPQKFDRDFRPMAATKNATTILYGTAWTENTLLAQQRAVNLERQQRLGLRCHFEHDWRSLAAINPNYRAYVESEIARLGEQNISIQTQYLLRPVSGENLFLNVFQRELLRGDHPWQDSPTGDSWYIASMDVGGGAPSPYAAPHQASSTSGDYPLASKRDSTVVTIGRVSLDRQHLPSIEVLHHQWWTGMPLDDQYAAASALVQRWGLRSLVVDATGLGAGLAAFLIKRFGEERIIPFTFTRPSKSRLAYQLLSLLDGGRLKLYDAAGAPPGLYAECWKQLRLARYRLPAPNIMDIFVVPAEGHDDFLISLALLTEALQDLTSPPASTLVRPRQPYTNESRF